MAERAESEEKPRVTLSDLTPVKEVQGGNSALHPEDPPLSIPPPGFVIPADGNGEH